MSNEMPREKSTAYRRWQVTAFDRPAASEAAAAPPAEPAARAVEQPPVETTAAPPRAEPASLPEETAGVQPTAEELQRIRAEAHTAGYAAGHAEGIGAAAASAAKLASVLDNLTQAVAGIEQEIADQLLTLAIEIAHQVLRQSLRLQPELILPLVREAVSSLHPHHGQPQLFLHPDDAALVREQLGEQLAHGNWRIIDDATLTAGGCRVELGASEVDATVETRWRRVIEAIGVSPEWLGARP
ncbi:MAG TPA: flagellar assembly protein FliH [Candidatus Accumulibacter phosphatis]|nr:MAG: Flagellar assembly protein FliH [Candidatus Accumulibacter sp. SK-11]HAY29000.1 flagellar assembly protein FliH [Accumulibacter sp.]HCV12293.1 flagellar assembly protein FliH [Accumulibacter sp.]HRQ96173.1 flagellar assembly protein FliH [Candidatus Accumulibacter phosphatis]